ncbi:hypothetical protein HOY80DRAFT_1009535 [Tuber brumale]|nr:hypothetical protein HOY80DRAFT_1009535 [Tuber brumale]
MPRLKFSKIPTTSVECLDCCLDFTAPPPSVTAVQLSSCFYGIQSYVLRSCRVAHKSKKHNLLRTKSHFDHCSFATRIPALGSNSIGVNQCHLHGQSSLNTSCSDAINCNLLEPPPAIGKSTLTAALTSEKMAIPCLPRQYG